MLVASTNLSHFYGARAAGQHQMLPYGAEVPHALNSMPMRAERLLKAVFFCADDLYWCRRLVRIENWSAMSVHVLGLESTANVFIEVSNNPPVRPRPLPHDQHQRCGRAHDGQAGDSQLLLAAHGWRYR